MIEITTLIIAGGAIVSALATIVIAGLAFANFLLSMSIKSASEQHQKEMNDILKAIGSRIASLEGSESRKEAEKERKEQEGKGGKAFVTQKSQ
jgi:hypothetical protein